jgi:hypothetical protein
VQNSAAVMVLIGIFRIDLGFEKLSACTGKMIWLKEFNVADDIFVGYSFVKALL